MESYARRFIAFSCLDRSLWIPFIRLLQSLVIVLKLGWFVGTRIWFGRFRDEQSSRNWVRVSWVILFRSPFLGWHSARVFRSLEARQGTDNIQIASLHLFSHNTQAVSENLKYIILSSGPVSARAC